MTVQDSLTRTECSLCKVVSFSLFWIRDDGLMPCSNFISFSELVALAE